MLACHGFFLLVTISLTLNAAEAGYLTYFENKGFVIKIAHDPDSSEEDAELETTTEKDQNENKGSTLADHKPVEESPSAHTNAAAPEREEKEETPSAGESQEPTPEPEKEEETPSPTPEPEKEEKTLSPTPEPEEEETPPPAQEPEKGEETPSPTPEPEEEETPPPAPHPEEEEEEEEEEVVEEEEEESPSVAPHPEEEEEEEEESPSVAKSTDGDSADTSQSTTPARPKKPRTRPWTGATYWGPNDFTVTPGNQHTDTNRRGEQVCVQRYEMKFEDRLSTYYSGVSVNCFPEGLEPIEWKKGDDFSVCGVVYYDKDNIAWKTYAEDGRQTCEGSKKIYGRKAFDTYVLYNEECDEIKRKIMCDDIDEEEPTEESKDPPENPLLRPYTGRSYSSPDGLTVSPGKRQTTTTRGGEEVCVQDYDMAFEDFVSTYYSKVSVPCFPEGQEPKDITNGNEYTVCGVVYYDKDNIAWTTYTEEGVTKCEGKQKIYGKKEFAYDYQRGAECEEIIKKIRCDNIGAQ